MREGWESMRLTNFVWFQRGFDLPRNNFVEGNVPVYGSTSILGYHNVSKVKAPGIITGRSGTLGKFQFANEDFWPHNTSLWVKDFKDNDEKFAYYLLQTLDFTLFNSGGAVPTLNRNLLTAYIVNIPPLETQRKIASILSGYDDLIENNLKRIKILEEMAQQTYEEWFVRMRFPGYETAVMNEETGLPEGWEKVKLVDLCDKIFDGTHDSPKQSEFGYKLITGKHLQKGKVDFETAYFISEEDHFKIKKRSELTKGDIMYSNIGTIGNLSMVYEDFEYSCKNMIVFRPKHNLQYFVYTYLFNENTKNKIIGEASGSTQKFISLGYIRNYEDYFPSLNFITDFSEYCNPIYKKINNLNKQNQRLREARDLLLPRLMMGIVEV